MTTMTDSFGIIAKEKLDREAREWVVKLHTESCDAKTQTLFSAWLCQSTCHQAAFKDAGQLWDSIGQTDEAARVLENILKREEPANQNKKNLRRLFGRPLVFASMAASVAVVCSILFLNLFVTPPAPVLYATKAGETQEFTLADHSLVTLAPKTSLTVLITKDSRLITLTQGWAYFDVAHDESLPFIVKTGQTEVRVLGTAFGVRQRGTGVRVTVTEGTVLVADLPDLITSVDEEVRVLTLGQQVMADTTGYLSGTKTVDLSAEMEWIQGRYVYNDSPLMDIVADLNGYRSKPIIITDPSLKALRITTTFSVDQADQVLEGLLEAQSLELMPWGEQMKLRKKID